MQRCNNNYVQDVELIVELNLQVELLESALQRNTIACLGSASSKGFLGLMVVKELSDQIRISLEEGGKRSIYLAESGITILFKIY
jgi:hypothetical protein